MNKDYEQLGFQAKSWPRCVLISSRMLIFVLILLAIEQPTFALAQKISIQYRAENLKQILLDISTKSGYSFLYKDEDLDGISKMTVRMVDKDVPEIVGEILQNTALAYTINGKVVSIYKKTPRDNSTTAPVSQTRIRGVITDSLGNKLPGVTVGIKGRAEKTVSDKAGEFSLNGRLGEVLTFRLLGFKNRDFLISSDFVRIELAYDPRLLQEIKVINTGYQSIDQERATGSYVSINASDLESKLQLDVVSAMEGLVTGMNITKGKNIEFRGISTFNAEKSPLIIMDGYPITGDLTSINKDNIENITILKDAVAASIYGARSSNGVIVITTKKGKANAFNAEYRGTLSTILKPDLSYLRRSSTLDYIEAETELYNQNPNSFYNSYLNGRYVSALKYLLIAKDKGLLPQDEIENSLSKLKGNEGMAQIEDHLFRNEFMQQHHISLSGGTDKNTALFSAKYIDAIGKVQENSNKQVLMDFNNSFRPKDWININLFSNLNYLTSKQPVLNVSQLLEYSPNRNLHPYDLIVDPDTRQPIEMYNASPVLIQRYAAIPGLMPMHYNLLDDLSREMNQSKGMTFRVGGNAKFKLIDGLGLTLGGVWSMGSSVSKSLYEKESYTMRSAYNSNTSISNSAKHYIPYGDRLDESRASTGAYTLRAQLDYNKSIEKHYITALLGQEITKNQYDLNVSPTRFGYNDLAGTFSNFNYQDYIGGVYSADMLGSPLSNVGFGSFTYRDNRFVSYYSNASYEYDQRFLLSGSIRMDLTNFFGTDPKYRYKPLWSIGGTYKLSNEAFFNNRIVNKLFIRGSYGLNGNISLNSGPFLVIAPGTYSSLTNSIPYNISSPPNNSLRWEKTKTTNIGMDMAFFNSRLNLTADYYKRVSSDLLAPDAIDPTLGYTSLSRNVGQINNTGIELNADARVLQKGKFRWNILGTFSHNESKVEKYDVKYLYTTSFITSVNREGYAASSIFSFRNAGLDKLGNPEFYDKDGKRINGAVATVDDLVYSGTLRPRFLYGLTNTFSYGDFDLSFLLIARTGNVMRKSVYSGNNIEHEDVSKRWRKSGDEEHTIYPVLNEYSFDAFYFPYADVFVESGAFLKLRDLSLRYKLNDKIAQQLRLKGVDFTFQARNLMMITANSQGLDPEGGELTNPDSQQAELGITPFGPRPEFNFGLRFKF